MKLKNITILIFLLLFILTVGAVSASSDNSTDVVAADDDNDLEMQSDSGQILASNEDDDVVCDVGNGTVLSKASSSLSIETLSEVYAGDNAIVKVLLTPSDATGDVELSVDGNTRVSIIEDGTVSFTLSGLTVGSHNLVASYSGDSNYERSNASATLNVIDDKSFEALQALINGAVDSLVLTKDYYGNGQEITITNTISIDGGGHTIDAKGLSRIFNIQADDVVLKNFNFINGFSDEDGGAIYWSGSNGLINSSTFVNSTANNSGAIYISVNADNGLIKSVSFINNTATVSGGAIRNQRGNNWTIEDSIFINNSAHGETNIIDAGGGAIWSCNSVMDIMNSIFKENNAPFGGALRGSFYISDSEFDSNTATDGNGGAIDVAADASFSYDLHLVFENLTFTNNIAKGDSSDLYDNERAQGGAIHLYDIQRVDMLNCACINNTADRGGAIDGYMMNVTYVDNCIFENNTALNYGGAVSMDSCIVSNCYFSNNIATGGDSQGGAVFFYEEGNVSNCNFTGNTADYGGAINIYSGSVTNCSFTNNSATDGGAIFRDSGSVENCYFTGNTADHGGAVYFESTGNVTNCDFAGNTASWKGGAIRMYSGSVENCYFTGNTATDNGGAVHFDSTGSVTNCNFVENSASWGGAIRMYSGTVTNCNFTNNTASGNGGAVYFWYHGTVTNCNFTDNTASSQGGAIRFSGSGTVTNCNFINHSATHNGGAVSFDSDGEVTNCTFTNNTASGNGGAVYFFSTGNVTNCTFTNNTASGNGGAVYFFSTGNVTNCAFTGNTAECGGAIYGEALVTLSTFRYNNAVNGSAMYNCEYENCIFEGNSDPKVYRDEEYREKPTINIFAPDIHLGEDIIVNITFSPIITGNVTVGLNGQNRTVEIIDGSGGLIVSSEGFNCGEYMVEVIFDGNEECLSNSNVTTFMILKSLLSIDVSTDTDEGYIHIILPADIGGSIQFTIGDIVKYLNETGNVDVKSLPAGDYSYEIRYDGDDRYESLSVSNTTRLTKSLPAIDIIVSNIAYGDVEKISIILPDDIEGNASFTFNNDHISINASAQWQYGDLTIGNYNVSIQYSGDSRYYGHSLNKRFTVMPKINLSQIIVIEDYGFVYIDLGNATGSVQFFIDDEYYDGQRIGGGKVNYNLPTNDIPVGNHNMTFKYVGNTFKDDIFTYWDEKSQDCLPISYPITILPKETKTNIESNEMTFLTATILDENNHIAYDAKGTVTFFVNGVKYAVVDVVDGMAKLDISKFKNGDYLIEWQYSGDAKYNQSSGNSHINVNYRISASALTMIYSSGKSYSVRVYGSNGAISGVPVTFLVNGKVLKTVKTNANGAASVVIKNAPGTYKITTQALGQSSTKTLKVTHVLSLKSVKVKKSAKKLVLTATLKKVNGKYLKSKKIIFKFNGKKFTVKTNKKGVAKVTIKAKLLKKLKAGKKVKYQATYLKDTVKKSVKVKK